LTRSLAVAVAVALALFAGGLLAVCHYWPDQHKAEAVLLILQFVAALALLVATVHYASAAWALVEAQDRPTEVHFLGRPTMPHVDGPPFHLDFHVVIVNPSVKSTMVRAEMIVIGQLRARNADHLYGGSGMHEWVKVKGGHLRDITVRGEFDACPISPGRSTRATLVFKDVIHGELGPYGVSC